MLSWRTIGDTSSSMASRRQARWRPTLLACHRLTSRRTRSRINRPLILPSRIPVKDRLWLISSLTRRCPIRLCM